MFWFYTGLKERVSHIKFSPNLTLRAVAKDFLDTWERVDVRDHIVIQDPVVVDPSRQGRRVSLRFKETWGSIGRGGGS